MIPKQNTLVTLTLNVVAHRLLCRPDCSFIIMHLADASSKVSYKRRINNQASYCGCGYQLALKYLWTTVNTNYRGHTFQPSVDQPALGLT